MFVVQKFTSEVCYVIRIKCQLVHISAISNRFNIWICLCSRHLPPQDLQPAQPAQPAQLGNDRGIDDETLRKLGKRLFTGVDELSSALGFQYADLKNYKAMNYQTGEVTAYGTIRMLFDWRERIVPSEQRAKLGQALQKARLIRVKEEYHL